MKKSLKLYDIQKSIQKSISGLGKSELGLDLAEIICEKPPISISKRIGIYQDAYRIRMVESLRDDFLRVAERIGKDEFEKLALEFIATTPSTFASLAEVSQKFPPFVKTLSEDLYELASVDWIEILSDTTLRIDAERLATIQEVESGAPFRLVRNPTLNSFIGKNNISVSYRDTKDVFVKNVTPIELEILTILKRPMTIDELSNQLQIMKIDLENIQSVISTLIKNEIIYCERTNYGKENS